MPEWKSSYGGCHLKNARLLTKEEIDKRYPIENNSRMAQLTREAVRKGYDILYGVHPKLSPNILFQYHDSWMSDVCVTAAYLYKTQPDYIIVGGLTDMSQPNAIYAAVKPMYPKLCQL